VRGFDNRSVEYLNLTGLLLLPAPYVLGRRLSSVLLRVAFRFDRGILAVRPSLHRFFQYVIIQVSGPR